MKSKQILTSLVLLGFMFSLTTSGSLALFLPPALPEAALGDSFSYQGYITYNGQPANGAYDFKFSLWEDSGGVTQVGSDITADDQIVSNGYFTVILDFGAGRFQGDKRWLKIEVRPGAETGAYNAISPLQELTPTPYALFAKAAPWAGLSGVPAGFADGIDNNTQYSAGNGLIRTGSDPNYTFTVDIVAIQSRVGGVCRPGSTIQAIKADGTVVCWDDAPLNRPVPPAGYAWNNPLPGALVGNVNQVTIGADGLPLILFSDTSDSYYKIAHCGDPTCLTATATRIDTFVPGSDYASMALDPDGRLQISYYTSGTTDLGFGRCADIACTSVVTQTLVSSSSDVGMYNDIIIARDGFALVVYFDQSDGALYILHCSDRDCLSSVTVSLIDPSGGLLEPDPSITMGADGLALVAYLFHSYTDWDLKVAHCTNIACTTNTATQNATPEMDGLEPSITTGADALGLIVHWDSDSEQLVTVHCSNPLCTEMTQYQPIHSVHVDNFSPQPMVTIGATGLGVITFYDIINPNFTQVIAYCNDLLCSSVTEQTWISGMGASAITISPTGNPLLTSPGAGSGGHPLQVILCRDPFCAEYFRRR